MAVAVMVAVAEGLGVAVAGTGLGEYVAEGSMVAIDSSVTVGKAVGAMVGAALQDTTNNSKIAEIILFNLHLSLMKHHTSNRNDCQ